jgi:ribosomal protein S6
MIKNYELSCLVSSRIDEIERDTIIENINKLAQEKGCEVLKPISISEVTLGYPINGEEKVQLLVLNFKYENTDLMDIKKEIEKDKKIIRCLLKKISPEKKMHIHKRKPKLKEEPKQKGKVELKDIDKKIEEIFNSTESPSTTGEQLSNESK